MKKILKQTLKNYSRHNISVYAAAFTYTSLIALPAIVLSTLYFAKIFLGSTRGVNEFITNISSSLPGESGEILTQFAQASLEISGFWTGLITLLLLLWSGSNLITFFTDAINNSFGLQIHPQKATILTTLKRKLLGMLSIIVFIGVICSSVFIGTVFASLFENQILFYIINFLLSFGIYTVLYTFIFKFLILVDAEIKVSMYSGMFLAFLTIISTALITFIFSFIDLTSNFALGASLVLFLIWINYLSTIIFLGFEFINVYLRDKGIIRYEELADEKYHKNMVIKVPLVGKLLGGLGVLKTEGKIGKWFLKKKLKK